MTTNISHQCSTENKLDVDIEKFGWVVVMIEATDYLPSFAYTVGLLKSYNHPELIIFGLKSKTAHTILNQIGNYIKDGQIIMPDQIYTEFFEQGQAKVIVIDKKNLPDYFGRAISFYNTTEFPALQLVWGDKSNKFPWDADFPKELIYQQPLLDRNANFKFFEAKNLGVFTTRNFLEQNKPILYVVHDDDGDWQFLTSEFLTTEIKEQHFQMDHEIKLVCLEALILKDNTLNEVFDLDYSESARRDYVGGKWSRSKHESTDNES